MRIVFAGTPAFGLPCLQALHEQGHDIVAVYTQPDRPAGRGRKVQASPIKLWALEQSISVEQPLHFKQAATVERLAQYDADVMIVIAYGLILPLSVLSLPKHGCVNVHASLLPRWRGAAPIQRAVCAGDSETGVTIMQMDVGMDTGAMLSVARCAIEPRDTAGHLHDTLSTLSVAPLLETLDDLQMGRAHPIPQDERLATYAPKITKSEANVRWNCSATDIDCLVRGYNPWPMAFTHFQAKPLRILAGTALGIDNDNASPGTVLSIDKEGICVACGTGVYRIETLQFSGRKALDVSVWLHGQSDGLSPGVCLGAIE